MIEYKAPLGFNLNKTTVVIEDTQLNAGSASQSFDFTGTPVLFITIENNTSVNFTEMHLIDGDDAVITHNAPLNPSTYSIAFSGKNSGQPLTGSQLFYLNNVRVEWNFAGLAVGTLTINIYTFSI
jgi:hypothetical protein